jgi:hypothetical protein
MKIIKKGKNKESIEDMILEIGGKHFLGIKQERECASCFFNYRICPNVMLRNVPSCGIFIWKELADFETMLYILC